MNGRITMQVKSMLMMTITMLKIKGNNYEDENETHKMAKIIRKKMVMRKISVLELPLFYASCLKYALLSLPQQQAFSKKYDLHN
jgi:hypothetical protein